MAKKRRNSGRAKPAGARGRCKRVRCEQSGVLVPKDKAVKRFIVRNIVDASAVRDIQDASAIEGYSLPKIYRKVYYSVSAAIHSKIVRVRSRKERRNREPPPRYRPPLFDSAQRTQPPPEYAPFALFSHLRKVWPEACGREIPRHDQCCGQVPCNRLPDCPAFNRCFPPKHTVVTFRAD